MNISLTRDGDQYWAEFEQEDASKPYFLIQQMIDGGDFDEFAELEFNQDGLIVADKDDNFWPACHYSDWFYDADEIKEAYCKTLPSYQAALLMEQATVKPLPQTAIAA